MQLEPYLSIGILYVLIVSLSHVPNTSSTNTPSSSTSAAVSDNILSTTATTIAGVSASPSSRSRMLNPCIGRGRNRTAGLSDGDRQFLSTSLWRKCLAECNLTVPEEADALVQLVTQSGELQETFNSFKDRFVYRVFRSDYNSYVEAYSHVVFQWLIPSSSSISSVNISNPQQILDAWNNYRERDPINVLLSAYDLFQRVAIAVEMVWADLKDHGRREYRRKYGRWWRQATGRSNRVIQSIYMSLHSHPSPAFNLTNLLNLRRNFVSESIRCVNPRFGETRRNMRDLTVLHNAIIIADFYRHMFVLYARHRIQHLLNQIDSQQQQEPARNSRSLRRHRRIRKKIRHGIELQKNNQPSTHRIRHAQHRKHRRHVRLQRKSKKKSGVHGTKESYNSQIDRNSLIMFLMFLFILIFLPF